MNEYNKQYADNLKKERKYKELFEYLSTFTESDIPQALNFLSECYYYGHGTEKNYTKCFELDLRAADYNEPDAIATLGFNYECGVGTKKDIDKAISLYIKASNMGSAKGTTFLAQCYEEGIGIEKDVTKAFGLYSQMAKAGHAKAQRLLGRCYEYGIGTDVDEKKAFGMYKSAAEQDSAIAQRLLGVCYENGIGTTVDKEKAAIWYRKAAEQNNQIAQRNLAMCYEYGDGIEMDIEKAVEWYLNAIENGDIVSEVRLACIYYDNFDDEEKDRIALKYLQKAVSSLENNSYYYSLACYVIALYYEKGYIVEYNPEKAFKYKKIAAEGGIENAMISLAYCYKDGIGTNTSDVNAIRWLEKGLESINNSVEKGTHYLTLGELYSSEFSESYDAEKQKFNNLKAFECFSDLIRNDPNNAEAELELGKLYFEGKGTEVNGSRAFLIFKKLSKKSDDTTKVYAEFHLAKCYFLGHGVSCDLKKGFKLIQKAGKDGHILSSFYEVCCYLFGVGVRKNYTKAKKVLRKIETCSLKNDNFLEEKINLYKGIICFHGLGTKKDLEKAKKFFSLSTALGRIVYAPICDGDYTKAEFIGLIYDNALLALDFHLLQNKKIAKDFLLYANESNTISALGAVILFRILTEQHFFRGKAQKKAFRVIMNKKGCIDANAEIYRIRGQCYFYGIGTKKDYFSAFLCFEKAFELGDDIAGIYLAFCYAYGKGVEKNYETAKSLLKKSCNNGDNTAKVLLGVLIYSGDWGLENNKTEGLKLINEGSKISLFKLLYQMISGKRGEFYKKIFLEIIYAHLHVCFTSKKRYYISSAMKLFFLMLIKNPYSENLTKKEMLRILLSQNEMLIEQNKSLEESQIDMNSVVNQIRTNTDKIPQIVEQQQELIALMHTVIDYVTEEKRNLPAENSLRFLDEEQLEQIQARFIEDTAEKLVSSLQDRSVSVESEEAFLKGMFGHYWETLDIYTRKALLSARVLFENCKGPEFSSLDHSGVVISATSALENEIKRRIFIGYQMFLKKEVGLPRQGGWPELMVFHTKNGDVVENKNLTLGSLPYLFECSDEDKQLFLRYLQKILSEKYVDLGMSAFLQKECNKESFVMRCEKVRKSYRNIAAHTGLVERVKAEACCNDIIGPNEASKKIGQVQGLLYDLVQMTENFSKL